MGKKNFMSPRGRSWETVAVFFWRGEEGIPKTANNGDL